MPDRKTICRTVVRVCIIAVIFLFLFLFIYKDWDAVKNSLHQSNIGWIIVALFFFTAGTLTLAICWRFVLRILGSNLSYVGAFRAFYWSILTKYIPGKVWSFTFRVIVSAKEGVPEGTAALGVVMESVMLIVSAGIIGGLTITQIQGDIPIWLRFSPVVSLCLLILLHPRIFQRCLPFLSRRFPSWVVLPPHMPSFRNLLGVFLLYCSVWVWWGLGFWFIIYAFDISSSMELLGVIGRHTLAWLAGFLSFLPGGLGVRELVLKESAAYQIGHGTAALSALFARLLILVGEMAGALVVGSFGKSRKSLDLTKPEC